ncbi:hypothetical protein EJ08DRAFT_648299 [Tothia fuscella]|uniref:ER membrane protein complex subunit 7 beta-sandwich domain-containing protein n=1 Tax=Tothia fuscella TaxID=1048955 RepID=A0A9P4NUZ8_9PEZI|nr:hypothetical protein EJ08DRAFT_648299 [Tothia fuscella]
MAKLLSLTTSLLTLLALTSAAHLTVSIPSSNLLPNPSILPPSTHATLHASGAPLSAPLTRANTFNFAHIPSGSYLLTIHCRDYFFEPLRVDVGNTAQGVEWMNAWQTFRGNEWDNKGERRVEVLASANPQGYVDEVKGKVEVRVLGAKDYYQQREGFSVMSLFKNPMILMALFSLVLIVGMPYLLENMDPEAKEEFEKMQKSNPIAANPATSLQNFDLAGWMAGASSTPKPVEEAPKESPKEAPKTQSSGARRKG